MKNYPINDHLVLEISRLAERYGFTVFVVGGYVRDYFLGNVKKDIDFTVIGDALEFAQITADHFRSKAVIYERFRTALVPVGDYHLEFVGTRKELYHADSRNPIVEQGSFEDDIKRRDFTVNSMAFSLDPSSFGQLIDLFHGIEDLEHKLLRTPLDPEITFSDDPLRMMRAARFASRLQFDIDPAALSAMKKMNSRIQIISQERITDEFLKILQSDKPSIGLNILHDTGLLAYVFPEVERLAGVELVQIGEQEYAHKDVFYHTLQVVDSICTMTDNLWLRFSANA